MAETQAEAAFGTLFEVEFVAGSGTYVAVAEVKDIDGPELSTEYEDATHAESPGSFEEVVPTILRTGEVSFPVQFLKSHATHVDASGGLLDLWKNKSKRNMRLNLGDGVYISFAAYVTGVNFTNPQQGLRTADVTVKPTGTITLPT